MKQNKSVKDIYSMARDFAIKKNTGILSCAHLCAALAQNEMLINTMNHIKCVDTTHFIEYLFAKSDEAIKRMQIVPKSDVKTEIENGEDVEMLDRIMDENFIHTLPKTVRDGYDREVRVSHLMLALLVHPAKNPLNELSAAAMRSNSFFINEMMNRVIAAESKEYGEPIYRYDFPIMSKNSANKQDSHGPRTKGIQKNADETLFITDMLKAAVSDNKPFVGREDEINSLIVCLERKDKPNAILVGEPGVGKTDIARGLARRILNGEVPKQLENVKFFALDISGMLAGAQLRGQFEERLKSTLEKLIENEDRPLIFIDEIHTLLGAGVSMDNSMDAANIMKPYLTQGKIRVIGATTGDEFRKYVEKDAAFMRRFDRIDVVEPSEKDAINIIENSKSAYEEFHHVSIDTNAVETAVNLSIKHMHDRYLPDKAIDILDQTAARVKLCGGKKVSVDDIQETLSRLCHIPKQTMEKSELDKVKNLDAKLNAQVFGQEHAVAQVAEAIQMAKVGLNDETKPIGSFLFVGPSGVGKTEIAKQLAATMGIEFIRFDMSEYAEAHTVAKLIGSPAGYVGYEDGGILVEKIRNNPHAVVLFDEIEKAHPDVFKIFLQMLDYGMLTDNKGRKADFRNTVIIMTSNAGNSMKTTTVGLVKSETKAADNSLQAIKKLMPPELIGRLSAIIHFNGLNEDVARLIVKKELKSLTARMKAQGYTVTYSDDTIKEIVKRGVSNEYGAREIQNVIAKEIKTMFTKAIIAGSLPETVSVDVCEEKFSIKAV